MQTLDYSILFILLGTIFVLGLAVARRFQTREEYHLASRSMGWFPIGMSLAATAFSATNFTGFAGEVFRYGFYVLMAIPVLILVAIPILLFVLPAYHARRPVSAYEWIEERFNKNVRRLASIMFLVWRLAWMALMLYATGTFLSAITKIPETQLVILTGIIATAYTALGGMRSVMFTDIFQFTLLFSSLVSGAAVAASIAGGWSAILQNAREAALFQPFSPLDRTIFSFDPTIRISFWSILFGGATAFLARYGVDQMVVQRYFTARSLQDARRGFLLNLVSYVLTLLCLAGIGLAIHAHSNAEGLLQSPTMKPMAHMALFIQSLPFGVAGFLVAGLCASTMSSMDSGVHSCCTALTTDFGTASKPLFSLQRDRIIVVAVGLLSTILALGAGFLQRSVFELANVVVNGLGSPILALFAMGFLRRYTTSGGVLVGGIVGLLFSIATGIWIEGLALHYYAFINLLGTIFFGLLFSPFFAGEKSPRSAFSTFHK